MKYQGISADKAADQVIQQELAKVGGTGGVILIDHKGKVGWSFNTEGMYRAKKLKAKPQSVKFLKRVQPSSLSWSKLKVL